jgi:alpha-N-acetylglucosamine transferase
MQLDLALVMAHSLKKSGTKYPLTVAILKEMSQRGRDLLERAGAIVAEVPIIPKPTAPLGRGGRTPREDREKVFTKLNIWNMTQFDKLLFLDSDTLILRNVDELFDIELKEGEIAAAIYCSFHCDCEHVWNSGVMLLRPSSVTLANLITGFSQLTWGGQGDQSYLNAYFRHFGGHKAISHNYNMGKNTVRCKFEMWQPDKFSIFHFAGNDDVRVPMNTALQSHSNH